MKKAKSYGLMAAVSFAVLTSAQDARAYEVSCERDDFTDENRCSIKTSQDGGTLTIALTDSKEDITLGVSEYLADPIPLFSDYLLSRVDNEDHRDLKKDSFAMASRRGFVLVGLDARYGREVIEEMIAGDTVQFRLKVFQGGYREYVFDTEGLSDAWNEFSKKTDF